MAEGEGGAGRAWTKWAVAQKGHARHAESRRNFAVLDYRFTHLVIARASLIPYCHREGVARGDPL